MRLALAADGDWLRGARHVSSPNCDRRPAGCAPDLIVIHGISLPPGSFGGPHVEQLFCNRLDPGIPGFDALRALRVSAHVLVGRDGAVVQFCAFSSRAWHAGVSSFAGRSRCNDFSIGIELEGCDSISYETVQYRRTARICALLMGRHPGITQERITGHSDIAPGRKTDPGPAFEWSRLHRELRRARRRVAQQ